MFKDLTARSPQLLGFALLVYGISGLLTGEMELDGAGEKIAVGLGLLGFHIGQQPSKPAKPAT